MDFLEPFNLVSFGRAAELYGAFALLMILGHKLLPARVVQGAVLSDGSQLTYRLNGWEVGALVTVAIAVSCHWGWMDLTEPVKLFFPLMIIANLVAILITAATMITADPGDRSGRFFHDFWIGTSLNPRVLGIDVKMFSYLPMLFGMVILNFSFAAVQRETHGFVSDAMWYYLVFTTLYVVNAYLPVQNEQHNLYMYDVMDEKGGLMLFQADWGGMPFIYCLPGWFLVDNLEPISLLLGVFLVVLYLFGYWLFRGANDQKKRFRRNPEGNIWGKKPETISRDGSTLLVSGFWGVCRKSNYIGEFLQYIAWTIPAGMASIWPWAIPVFLIPIFIHRAIRDETKCQEKYGELWEEYCQRVPYRFIPGLY